MGLEVSNLNDKWVWSVRLAINDQLSHDGGEVCHSSERSNPPLGRSKMRRVDCEGLVIGVPCCCRLQSSDVTSVSQLSLRVTSDVVVVLCRLEVLLVLLWGSLVPQSLQVHALVQTVGERLTDELVGDLVLVESPFVLDRELSQLLCSSQCALKLVDSAAEVVLALLKHRLGLEDSEDFALSLKLLLSEQEGAQLIDIDLGGGTFLVEDIGALRVAGLEVSDPLWYFRHIDDTWNGIVFDCIVTLVVSEREKKRRGGNTQTSIHDAVDSSDGPEAVAVVAAEAVGQFGHGVNG